MRFIILNLMLLSINFGAFSKNIVKDSLRTEIKNNLVYVVHKVEPGQTLYSLINKYNCKLAEVFELNPSLNNETKIKLGENLLFPLIINNKHVSAWAYKKGKTKNDKALITKSDPKKYHEIKPKETVYSLSKTYGIDLLDLIEANEIEDFKIKINQKILIDKDEIRDILEKKSNNAPKNYELIPISRSKKISEEGVALVINTKNRSKNFYALHKTAPVGSIIQVTNSANGLTVNVQVVGNLVHEGPDQNIMMKLSPYAYSQLSPKDSKIRANIIYYIK
jgi:LysM repeat protein